MILPDDSYQIQISARHVHLSAADFKTLFGPNAQLEVAKPLSVRGEFKSDKTVTILGPKRNLERVAVLGPVRAQTQVEIAVSDTYTLGVTDVPARLSGDLQNAAPVTLVGPAGQVTLPHALIIALRHVHMNAVTMQKYGLQDGQTCEIVTQGPRAVTFHNVIVRQSDVATSIVHLDTDEGNAIK